MGHEADHSHRVPRLRMGGGIPPFLLMPSYHADGQLYFAVYCNMSIVKMNYQQ
jgi:hypothetical protein